MWKQKEEQTPVKAKGAWSVGKVHLTTHWNAEDMLLEEYVEEGQTVNQEIYLDTLIQLGQAIKAKRHGKLSRMILFIHDNAKPHTPNWFNFFSKTFDGMFLDILLTPQTW